MTYSYLPLPSAETLRALLDYDPQTGEFRWRRYRPGVTVGQRAGTLHKTGYRHLSVEGVTYKEHRLVWKYMTGEDPPDEVDHKNGKTDDNRWGNLRAASRTQNTKNNRVRVDTSTGVTGVSYYPQFGKYIAQITVNKKHHFLGRFGSLTEAVSARRAAEILHFGEFRRARE